MRHPEGSTSFRSSDSAEFRNLCQLLTLATAVNNPDGLSKLYAHANLHCSTEDTGDAVATILVREHESLACIFEKSMDSAPGTVLVVQDDGEPLLYSNDEYGATYRMVTTQPTVTTSVNMPSGYHLHEAGTNHWPEVRDSDAKGWHFLHREVSLVDHMATVSGYLNDYKSASRADQMTYSTIFSDYLTSVCWRKNHRRMNHWGTIGLIAKLDRVSGFWDTLEPRKIMVPKADILLAKRLDNLNHHGKIDELMTFLASRVPSGNLPELLKECKPGASHILFSQKTFQGFHDLLIVVLIAYSVLLQNLFRIRTLEGFMEVVKNGQGPQNSPEELEKERRQTFQTNANHVSHIAQLLTAILHSHALESYLQFLSDMDALKLPTSKDPYDEFARLNLMEYFHPPRQWQNRCHSLDESRSARDNMNDGKDLGPGAAGAGRKDCGEGEDSIEWKELDLGDNDIDEEQQTVVNTSIGNVIRACLTSFVGHYAAKRHLERYCDKLLHDKAVNIHFLGGKGTRRQVASWEEMKRTIMNAMSSESPSVSAAAIEYLQMEISSGPGWNPIFPKFRALLQNEPTFRHFVVHCETLIAAIAKYGLPSNLLCDTELMALIKNLDLTRVAVSKPCCPTCWEFMCVLRAEAPGHFNVRARHSTLYPVELPECLPESVVQLMVKNFQGYLCSQLQIMVQRHQSQSAPGISKIIGHRSMKSVDSDSGFTIKSDDTEKSDLQQDGWSGDMSNVRALRRTAP